MSEVSRSHPLVSVIVVSYNTREMTLACLRSLASETTVEREVIVVDNASSDGSARAIAAEFPQVRLIAESVNHGFARANNIAACEATGRYLLLLNPDTVVLDGAVDRLIEFATRTPKASIWGGRTLFGDRSLNPASCWRRMTAWSATCRTFGLDAAFPTSRWLNVEAYGGWDRDDERAVDIVSGCFFLIDRHLWDRLGGFDLSYEMYGEEADLCHRARAVGARPRITPEATIVHYGGASEAVRSDKHVRLIRAKITLARRHLRGARRVWAVWMLRLWPLSRWIAAAVLTRVPVGPDTQRIRDDWRAVWSDRSVWWDGYPAATAAPGADS